MGTRIDGPGLAKLETLEQALTLVQRLNTIVERMAQSQRMMQPLAQYRQQIQRAAAPIASLLKPQFGMISDQVAQFTLITTRGGGDQMKVRALREVLDCPQDPGEHVRKGVRGIVELGVPHHVGQQPDAGLREIDAGLPGD